MAPVDLKLTEHNVEKCNSHFQCIPFRSTDAQVVKLLRESCTCQHQEKESRISDHQEELNSISAGFIDENLLKRIRRGVFAYIDLDVLGENVRLLKKLCHNPAVGVIGVVKGNAYGHGAVPVSRYLTKVKVVDRLAVANIPEAIQLRRSGVEGVIHVLGNTQPWSMEQCIQYQLIPTVATQEAVRGMAEAVERYRVKVEQERIWLDETVRKYEERLEEVETLMNQLMFEEHRGNSLIGQLGLQQSNSINQCAVRSPNLYMMELLSNTCNDRIEQLQNTVRELRQRKQVLDCRLANKSAVSTEETIKPSSDLSIVLTRSSEPRVDVKYSSDADVSDQRHSVSIPIRTVNRNTENGEVKEYDDDVISYKKDDVTLRYSSGIPVGTVHIKVDTGMSRNGCQPKDLDALIQLCGDIGVHVEGIFTHICNHEDSSYSKHQMDTFRKCTESYEHRGFLFHVSNSGSVINDIGTGLPMIRPGLAMYGMSPGMNLGEFSALGFRPSMSIKGTPSLVKLCPAGTKIGYGCAYTCPQDEWIATFPVGYADGISRDISKTASQYVIRDLTGEKCHLVGRISMDAITVRVPEKPKPGELFTLISSDYDPVSSITGISRTLDTVEHEVLTRLSSRLPRVYKHTTSDGTVHSIWPALDLHPDD